MRKFIRALSVITIIAMAVVSINVLDSSKVEAKKKVVKSLKVKGASKALTLKIGNKKTYKVVVKAKKKKTAFTAKSSNAKIVKVTKKGKKITVQALKAGKAKVTVKSKFNKKKKYVMTVTVPANKKAVVSKIGMTAKSSSADLFIVTFSKAVNLTASNLVVKMKPNGSNNYNVTVRVDSVTTNNKKTYYVHTERIQAGIYVKFTIPSIDKNSSAVCKTVDKSYAKQNDVSFAVKKGERFNKSIELPLGASYKIKSVSSKPNGVNCTISSNKQLLVSGTINNVGRFSFVALVENDMGVIDTYKITLVVADVNTLQVFCAPKDVFAYNKNGVQITSSGILELTISGGSNNYFIHIDENSDSIFSEGEDNTVLYETSTPGNYSFTVEVTDRDNDSLRVEYTYTLNVKEYLTVNGTVTNEKKTPIEGAVVTPNLVDKDLQFYVLGESDSSGKYSVFVEPGKYFFVAKCKGKTVVKDNQDIKTSKSIDFTINGIYRILVNHNDTSNYGYWADSRGTRYGKGNYLYLTNGNYNLTTSWFALSNNSFIKYEAKVSLRVSNDATINPSISSSDAKEVEGALSLGNNNITEISNKRSIYSFKASNNAVYSFKSDFTAVDPDASLHDEQYLELAYDDDSGKNNQFMITKELQAGKTYYLEIGCFGNKTGSGKIIITRE